MADADLLCYRNKVILAPMVRASTLPLRMLALEYGADIVFGEEIIDKKVAQCRREENALFGTNDYLRENVLVFRSHPRERERMVFQLGTADSVSALKAAEMLSADVRAFDINMGCPKHFSVSGGMGSQLLATPERAADIISTLRRNLAAPVSCKIRLLSTTAETVEFAKRMEMAGASAVTVHCRTVKERPHDPAHWADLTPVVDALSIPVVCNGDVRSLDDAKRVREQTGCAGVMIARAALDNPSVFRKEGPIDQKEAWNLHIRKCIDWDDAYPLVKAVYLRYIIHPASEIGQSITKCKSLRDIAVAFGQESYYDTVHKERAERARVLGESAALARAAATTHAKEEEKIAIEWRDEGLTCGGGGGVKRERSLGEDGCEAATMVVADKLMKTT